MRAVITVIGKDTMGIIATVSDCLLKHSVNIVDISQTILQDMFAMIMMADISKCDVGYSELVDILNGLGTEKSLSIHVQHEDIFNSMHRI